MKYKMLWIKGVEGVTNNYKRRVYIISQTELDNMTDYLTFILRESVDGHKIYRSVETDKCYMVTSSK